MHVGYGAQAAARNAVEKGGRRSTRARGGPGARCLGVQQSEGRPGAETDDCRLKMWEGRGRCAAEMGLDMRREYTSMGCVGDAPLPGATAGVRRSRPA